MGTIFEHFGCQMGSILEHSGVKIWVLGAPGGLLGAMLDPMAGQRGASSEKGTKRLTPGSRFWEPFLGFFSDVGCFFVGLISSRFLDGF